MTNNEMPDEIYVGKDGWFSIQDEGAETNYTRTDLVIRKDDAVLNKLEDAIYQFIHEPNAPNEEWVLEVLGELQKLRGG